MLEQRTEVRCPSCQKVGAGLTADFAGLVTFPCRRCKAVVRVGDDGGEVVRSRLACPCHRWLATGSVRNGAIVTPCRKCRVLVAITTSGCRPLEAPPLKPPTDDALVDIIEERWRLLRLDKAHRTAEVAVGLRFDVFNRDGFRCRYCGRGPDQGVFLEADHVIPRSAGGPDTLVNLVTACWECNRGKSAKQLAG